MAPNKKLVEINLKVAKIEGAQVTLADDDSEIIVPFGYLPKGIALDERVVLSIEPESDHAARKTENAKDILNEILSNNQVTITS